MSSFLPAIVGSVVHLVRYELKDHVATIVLNRPARLNAVNTEMMREFTSACEAFAGSDDAWIAILTGTGRAFSVGMDLHEKAESGSTGIVQPPAWLENPFWTWKIEKPIIGAINGLALGGGFLFALRCDLRIASTESYFQLSEVARGSIAAYDLMLCENLPYCIASEILSGEALSAARAKEIGFVNDVVSSSTLMDAAHSLADSICRRPPLAVQHNLRLHRQIRLNRMALGEAVESEAAAIRETLGSSHDRREALSAFVEKREPRFLGK